MYRRTLAIIAALVLPLALYGIPYAYASVTSSSYVVTSTANGTGNSAVSATAACNSGDYATGGGVEETGATTGFVFASKPQLNGGDITSGQPNAWFGGVETNNGVASVTSFGIRVWVVCQSPIAVAGVTVPEFGSFYVAVALAAGLYFALTALRQKHSNISPPT